MMDWILDELHNKSETLEELREVVMRCDWVLSTTIRKLVRFGGDVTEGQHQYPERKEQQFSSFIQGWRLVPSYAAGAVQIIDKIRRYLPSELMGVSEVVALTDWTNYSMNVNLWKHSFIFEWALGICHCSSIQWSINVKGGHMCLSI